MERAATMAQGNLQRCAEAQIDGKVSIQSYQSAAFDMSLPLVLGL